VLQRADSRLFKLREKIKSAPFLQEVNIDDFINDGSPELGELPFENKASTV
jgi:hypothetical protein